MATKPAIYYFPSVRRASNLRAGALACGFMCRFPPGIPCGKCSRWASTVTAHAAALAVLQEMAKSHAPGGFLFHNRTGNNLSAAGGAFKLADERAGLHDLNFHDLRHTFATRVRLHADAYTLRDLLGHSRVDTSNIYVNTASLEEQRGAVDALVERPRVIEASEKFQRGFTANER